MVRDSRTPGTYTLSVFTKAIVRYGANLLTSMGRDSPEGGREGGTHSNVRQSRRSRGHWQWYAFPDPTENVQAREIKDITVVTYLANDRAGTGDQALFPVSIPHCRAVRN